MGTWQELHIQSNLPLIVLTISLICIVIIGFLEFKKVSLRLDESWSKQPTTYTKGIHMNNQGIEEYVKDYDTRWSLY